MDSKLILTEVEVRVLAVLIEKALTSAGAYPMTINAVVLGANQLQNREPVTAFSESEVSAAMRTLEHKGLVAQAATSAGARAVRFEHRVVDRLGWDRREQAVMAELMLRGRQTTGELRTRASRMTQLPDMQAVVAVLDALKSRTPPFVEELAREPGRSANRFRHLLAVESAEVVSADGPPSLETRVARLEAELQSLKDLFASRGSPTPSPFDAGGESAV